MKIFATFVNFKYDDELVELVHAWDEYTVDSNPGGYDRSKAEALASYGADVLQVVEVEIEVPMRGIYARFEPVQVKATLPDQEASK